GACGGRGGGGGRGGVRRGGGRRGGRRRRGGGRRRRRAQVRGQQRDERVLCPAEAALGGSGRARKDRGQREAGDVDVPRRRRHHEGEHPVVETAAEVGGLIERAQVRVEPCDERVGPTARSGLGAAAGAR